MNYLMKFKKRQDLILNGIELVTLEIFQISGQEIKSKNLFLTF